MPSHPTYDGPLKVKVLPPGVCGSDFAISPGKLGMRSWGTIPEGHETVKAAAKRLGLPVRTVYELCTKGKLECLRTGRDRSIRVYVKKLAVPQP